MRLHLTPHSSLALALYFRFLGKKGTSTQVALQLQLQGCTRISRPFRVSDSKVKGRQASVSTRLHQHPSSESSLSRYSCFPRSSLSPFESCLNTSATPRDCEEGVLRESEREEEGSREEASITETAAVHECSEDAAAAAAAVNRDSGKIKSSVLFEEGTRIKGKKRLSLSQTASQLLPTAAEDALPPSLSVSDSACDSDDVRGAAAEDSNKIKRTKCYTKSQEMKGGCDGRGNAS